MGGSVLVLLVLAAGFLIWGIGMLKDRLPTWRGGGEKIFSAAIMKAEEILPGVKEKIREVAPGLTETVEKVVPGLEISGKDVGGEDIKRIPRYPDMTRVSYSNENQRRIVAYKGRVRLEAVRDFYQKELAALGYRGRAVTISAGNEVYQYKREAQELEFRFRKLSGVLSEITELTIKEL